LPVSYCLHTSFKGHSGTCHYTGYYRYEAHNNMIYKKLIIISTTETHCFQPSPYFRGQYVGTRQKQNIISVDPHSVTTMPGFFFS
jgi:hypothetical protein